MDLTELFEVLSGNISRGETEENNTKADIQVTTAVTERCNLGYTVM
jgi:hypothetical protein